jgi:hypothetical protein
MLGPLLLGMLLGAALIGRPLLMIGSSDDVERKLCDRAVDELLNSKDLVEVTRAGIVIQEIPCSIMRRLPPMNSEEERR